MIETAAVTIMAVATCLRSQPEKSQSNAHFKVQPDRGRKEGRERCNCIKLYVFTSTAVMRHRKRKVERKWCCILQKRRLETKSVGVCV